MSTPDERTIPPGPGGDSASPAPARTAGERLAAALPKSALTIDTNDEDPVGITVNRVWHRIRFYEDFSYLEHRRFERLEQRGHELAALAAEAEADGFTDEEADTLAAALDDVYGRMVRLVLPTLPAHLVEEPLPDDPHRPLSTMERMAIVSAFLSQVAERSARRATAALATARRPGKRSSRKSVPAMGTIATGTSKRRSGVSAPRTATSPD